MALSSAGLVGKCLWHLARIRAAVGAAVWRLFIGLLALVSILVISALLVVGQLSAPPAIEEVAAALSVDPLRVDHKSRSTKKQSDSYATLPSVIQQAAARRGVQLRQVSFDTDGSSARDSHGDGRRVASVEALGTYAQLKWFLSAIRVASPAVVLKHVELTARDDSRLVEARVRLVVLETAHRGALP